MVEPGVVEEREAALRVERVDAALDAEAGLTEMYRLLDAHHALWSADCLREELRIQRGEDEPEATTAEIEAVVRTRWEPEWREEIKDCYRTRSKRGMSRDVAIRAAYIEVCRMRSVSRVGVLPEVHWP